MSGLWDLGGGRPGGRQRMSRGQLEAELQSC